MSENSDLRTIRFALDCTFLSIVYTYRNTLRTSIKNVKAVVLRYGVTFLTSLHSYVQKSVRFENYKFVYTVCSKIFFSDRLEWFTFKFSFILRIS